MTKVHPFSSPMDYSKKTRPALIELCKEHKIAYSGKNKDALIALLNDCVKEVVTPTPLTQTPEYSTMTREELVTICKEKGHTVNDKRTTGYLIKLLTKQTPLAQLKMIDLFAGTGAFSYAFEGTGKVKVVYANDMVEHSKKIYNANFTHALTLQDLNAVKIEDVPAHDILTGGFPCQPFSIAGRREGFDDTRSNVFWKILEIIDARKPKCVVLENVKNLLSHDEGNTFKTIKENLEKRGYNICNKVLDTAEITGIPQHRERIYIVCIKSKEVFDKFNLDFPKITKRKISEFLEADVPSKYYYTDKSSTWDLVHTAVTKKDTIYQYRRVYVRENKSSECPTLTANMGGGGHNVPLVLDDKGIRKLTPRECFNFQGFPSTYVLPQLSDSNLYKLAGNAVSVPVVKLIANRLVPLLM